MLQSPLNRYKVWPYSGTKGASSRRGRRDSIVLNVTKDRGPCAACKTTNTIEVLISMFYMYKDKENKGDSWIIVDNYR